MKPIIWICLLFFAGSSVAQTPPACPCPSIDSILYETGEWRVAPGVCNGWSISQPIPGKFELPGKLEFSGASWIATFPVLYTGIQFCSYTAPGVARSLELSRIASHPDSDAWITRNIRSPIFVLSCPKTNPAECY